MPYTMEQLYRLVRLWRLNRTGRYLDKLLKRAILMEDAELVEAVYATIKVFGRSIDGEFAAADKSGRLRKLAQRL